MSDRLQEGQRLNINDKLVSPNGIYTLWMQGDGNLVLYHDSIDVRTAYWATDTWWLPENQRPVYALMQGDAHFVLYDTSGAPRWASGTWGPGYVAPYIVLQDDGNLVIYHNGTQPVWASGGVGGAGAILPRGYLPAPAPAPAETIETGLVHTDLGANHHMWTKARLNKARGRLEVNTRCATFTWFGGYHGGVQIAFVDKDDYIIGTSRSVRIGVDGTAIGNNDRTEPWSEEIPLELAKSTDHMVVIHYWAVNWSENLNRWLGVGKQIGAAVAEVYNYFGGKAGSGS